MRSGVSYVINSFVNGSNSLVALSLHLDEIVLVLDTAIKFLCLKYYNATYPEYFYGFERSQGSRGPLMSAILLGVYPYARSKLDKLYTQLKINKDYSEYTGLQKVFHHALPPRPPDFRRDRPGLQVQVPPLEEEPVLQPAVLCPQGQTHPQECPTIKQQRHHVAAQQTFHPDPVHRLQDPELVVLLGVEAELLQHFQLAGGPPLQT